jgi:hypothetical protein
LYVRKAGDGNRTHMTSLEGWSITTMLHPPKASTSLRDGGPEVSAPVRVTDALTIFYLLFSIYYLYSSMFHQIINLNCLNVKLEEQWE